MKDFIIDELKKEIQGFKRESQEQTIGYVMSVGDGVARLSGLSDCEMNEMLAIKTKAGEVDAVALNLEEDNIGAVILDEFVNVCEGDEVRRLNRILDVPVGDDLVGRVVSPLGKPLDGKGDIKSKETYPVEKIASGVIERESVHEPVQTGLKAIDSMIPIGRGQRELIIGDRQTGKTAIAIDTIINQAGQNMKCIYVAIGQKESKIAQIVAKLEEHGAMDYTTVVLAGSSDPAPLSYIAPYAGTAMAEYFLDRGEDVLVVYDDLSKHAVSYREISLLLRRPPGREAYPGDVFYLHSRLLERACKLNSDHGGGSITALPVIETQSGDVSAYIPTNVISITDGQVYLEPDLFNKGIKPAINAGLSVSRVGGSAQTKAMKKVGGKLRMEFAQFRELEAFAQFSSDLDKDAMAKLERGKRLTEIFKQDQYSPLTMERQVIVFFAVTRDLMNDVPVERIREFEFGLLDHIEVNKSDVLSKIKEKGDLDENMENDITQAIKDYKASLDYIEREDDKQ